MQHCLLSCVFFLGPFFDSPNVAVVGKVRDVDLKDRILTLKTDELLIHYNVADAVKVTDTQSKELIQLADLKENWQVKAIRPKKQNTVSEIHVISR